VTSVHAGRTQRVGMALASTAALLSSAGNLYSQRLFSRGIAVIPGTAFAMGYSALAVIGYCLVAGVRFAFDPRPAYLLSLGYLAVLGSVIAFGSFLTLIKRIGAGRSGYTAAVIPVVAMLVSTLFEGYRWTFAALAGIALVLAGTVLVLRSKQRASASA
jgi:drug/metabolite transporter (DMT)-like permease